MSTPEADRVHPARCCSDATPGSNAELEQRASRHPRRDRIITLLRDAPIGLSVSEIAVRTGLHPNTTRWHLGYLADAGLVRSRAERRGEPGRPRLIYEALDANPQESSYHLLSQLLASALTQVPQGAEAARTTGATFGRHLIAPTFPFGRVQEADAADRVQALLQHLGVRCKNIDSDLELRHPCFEPHSEPHGQILKALFRGLVEGALDALGGALVVGDVQGDHPRGAHVLRLVAATETVSTESPSRAVRRRAAIGP